MEKITTILKKIIPKSFLTAMLPSYHLLLSTIGAVIYRLPARKITVIGITGTKGKTSSAEILNAIFEAGGKKTSLVGTLRIKIGEKTQRNMYKMTLPGRFFVQKFLRQSVNAGCDIAILEISSEGARFHRHAFSFLNGLIFLNIAPEHIESHGGFENYLNAKLSIGKSLAKSPKENRIIVANKEDVHSEDFFALDIPKKIPFSISEASNIKLNENGSDFIFQGKKIKTNLLGEFNIANIIACAHMALAFGVSLNDIVKGVESLKEIKGRGQKITLPKENTLSKKQDFTVIVDYAHTPNSLEAIYKAFEHERKICILGNTGGGRDTWKRPEMGKIADTFCSKIILTNEDPYDEDPKKIVADVAKGIRIITPEIIMDRREAISKAISSAKAGDVVIITGKGTDPFIMGSNGTKQPWDDATVAREELEKVLGKR